MQGAPFTYNPQDLLLGIRSAGSAYDLVVDIGPASYYYNASPGGIFNVNNYSSSQVTSVFGGLSGLSFSVFGDVRTAGNATYPLNTLWVTQARTDITTQTSPWNRQSTFSQGNPGAKIDGIANGALTFSGTIPADPGTNTASSVTIPKTWNASGIAYSVGIGSGNLAGTFQGSIENTTPSGFESSGSPVISDLYQVKPGSGSSDFLGYFQLGTDGSLKFYSVPEPAVATLVCGALVVLGLRRSSRQRQ